MSKDAAEKEGCMLPEGIVTAQSIFNTVARHLLTQGERSSSSADRIECAYRGLDGRKCAIGCLIPDEMYSPSIEGERVNSTAVRTIIYQCGLLNYIDLLSNLQTVHDGYTSDAWRMELGKVAQLHNLDTDVLKEFA